MGLDNLNENIASAIDTLKDGVVGNPLLSTGLAVGVGAVGAGVVAGGLALASNARGRDKPRKRKSRKTRTSKNRRRKIKHTKRGWKMDRKRRSKQKWEVAYQKRKGKKSKSKRGIHYTKNGQPYKIMANGRARFIKK